MNEAEFKAGLIELDSLALSEYQESLPALFSDSDIQRSVIRLGRLVGVLLKEPFAIPEALITPSHRTAAYRAWHLVDQEDFGTPTQTATWQHQVLVQMRQELVPEEPYLEQLTDYQFAYEAQNEAGFFGFFARTLRKYICGNPQIRKKVEESLKAAGKTDNKIPVVTPEIIIGTGGLTVGVVLVQNIPILGIAGAPVIAAVVVILYTLGVDAFCNWSAQLRTDEDEKR